MKSKKAVEGMDWKLIAIILFLIFLAFMLVFYPKVKDAIATYLKNILNLF